MCARTRGSACNSLVLVMVRLVVRRLMVGRLVVRWLVVVFLAGARKGQKKVR